MNIKPLKNKILLLPVEKSKTTRSGLIVDSDKDKTIEGKVLAIGPDVKEVKIEDTILYKKYGPDEIEIDGKKYLVGEEEDILAIIN